MGPAGRVQPQTGGRKCRWAGRAPPQTKPPPRGAARRLWDLRGGVPPRALPGDDHPPRARHLAARAGPRRSLPQALLLPRGEGEQGDRESRGVRHGFLQKSTKSPRRPERGAQVVATRGIQGSGSHNPPRQSGVGGRDGGAGEECGRAGAWPGVVGRGRTRAEREWRRAQPVCVRGR